MSPVINERVLFIEYADGYMQPGVNTKYVEEQIDLDNISLNGGVLLKTIALSSDPYLRDRMRNPDIIGFSPIMNIGQPYVDRLAAPAERPLTCLGRYINRVDNFGIAKVLRSEDPQYSPGDYVSGYLSMSFPVEVIIKSVSNRLNLTDFETYSVWPSPSEQQNIYKQGVPLTKLDLKGGRLSPSLFVGTLGMPGMNLVLFRCIHVFLHYMLTGGSAYGGFKVFAEDKAKKVCIRNHAVIIFHVGITHLSTEQDHVHKQCGRPARNVSLTHVPDSSVNSILTYQTSLVIQLAKLANPSLKIIGSAGTKEKIDWLKSAGADVAFNYKSQDTNDILKKHGPIDMYVFLASHVSSLPNHAYLKLLGQRRRCHPRCNTQPHGTIWSHCCASIDFEDCIELINISMIRRVERLVVTITRSKVSRSVLTDIHAKYVTYTDTGHYYYHHHRTPIEYFKEV